jgi:hypothetical protein
VTGVLQIRRCDVERRVRVLERGEYLGVLEQGELRGLGNVRLQQAPELGSLGQE